MRDGVRKDLRSNAKPAVSTLAPQCIGGKITTPHRLPKRRRSNIASGSHDVTAPTPYLISWRNRTPRLWYHHKLYRC